MYTQFNKCIIYDKKYPYNIQMFHIMHIHIYMYIDYDIHTYV